MNPTLKNVIAVVVGLIVGMVCNMLILMLGFKFGGFPEGLDFADPDSLKNMLPNFELKHFITPFLAHASQALVGGFVAAKIAANNKMKMALIVGGLSLLGGIMNILNIGGPMWYNALDVILAYIPMSWLGARLAGVKSM